MSPLMYQTLNPFIQLLRPISPLAWMPLALFVIKDSELSAIFVIFICSIWHNLDLTSVIFSILMIGVVGMLLDLILTGALKLVEYKE